MRRMMAIALVLAVPWLVGCESRLFHFVITIDKTNVFPIDQTGAFEVGEVITQEDILSALDVPEGARITGVDIENLSVRIVVKQGNAASRLKVSGSYEELATGKLKMFENYPIVLAGANVPFIGINSLIAEGISRLRSKLEGYVKNLDNAAFFIYLSGDSDPPGQPILLDIYLKIRATIKYDECVDVPSVTSGGDDCDIE